MLSLSIYLFGATYIIRGKLAPVMRCKPFGGSLSPQKFDCIGRIHHTLPKYRDTDIFFPYIVLRSTDT